MRISDSYNAEAIDAADTNLSGEKEAEAQAFAQELLNAVLPKTSDITEAHEKQLVELLVTSFVAGRTYQVDLTGEPVPMPINVDLDPFMAVQFMKFLAGQIDA